MVTRDNIERVLPIGSKVLSGGRRSRFRIEKFNERGIRVASTSSRKTALLRFNKLELVLSNFDAIDPSRIQTSIMELMKAHGIRWTENETFLYGLAREYRNLTGVPNLAEMHIQFDKRVYECIHMGAVKRHNLLKSGSVKPDRILVQTTVFVRNPAVVAEVLVRAAGYCERCLRGAPFQRRTDRTPYLEVHHRLPLAMGGDDSVENAIALCPNCHRNEHYG